MDEKKVNLNQIIRLLSFVFFFTFNCLFLLSALFISTNEYLQLQMGKIA